MGIEITEKLATKVLTEATGYLVDHIWIDTLSIGDGSMGKRSAKLGMPQVFHEHGLSKWYRDDLHVTFDFVNAPSFHLAHLPLGGPFPDAIENVFRKNSQVWNPIVKNCYGRINK